MAELKPYKTLIRAAEDEFIVNKSRFICYGCPCETEEEALAFINRIRKMHPQATHNCYAYIIGENMGVMRYSDDGEPGGTAGVPILEVLKQRKVVNAALVVTRYFGGVLLGAGGLVRAYSQGASIAVNACEVGDMHPTARVLVDVPYPLLNKVDFFLKSAPVIAEDRSFGESVTLTLLVRLTDEEELFKKLIDLSDGTLEPVEFDKFYHPWREQTAE